MASAELGIALAITDKDGVDIVMGQRLPGFADYYTGERDSEVMGAIKMARAEAQRGIKCENH